MPASLFIYRYCPQEATYSVDCINCPKLVEMRISILFTAFLLLLAFSACKSGGESTPPGVKPDEANAQLWLERIIRYTAKQPEKATHENKFEARFDEYYAEQMRLYRVERHYHDAANGDDFLLISRPAPSIKEKRVATGIRLRMENDSLLYYNEVFRSWKMELPELEKKSNMLFALMVEGKDLSPYYPQNSGKAEYIEFPDPHTRYDVEARRWVTAGSSPEPDQE